MLNDQRMVTTLFIPHIDSCMEMITKNIFSPLPSIRCENFISLEAMKMENLLNASKN